MKKFLLVALWVFITPSLTVLADDIDDLFNLINEAIEDEDYIDFEVEGEDELDKAIAWMYDQGLTKFPKKEEFEPKGGLSRQAGSKFYGVYAREVLGLERNPDKYDCNFGDRSKFHAGLAGNVDEACEMGLFKGSKGNFLPKEDLTNGQALVVFIKATWGIQEGDGGHFAYPFWKKARNLGYTSSLNLDKESKFDDAATRGDIAVMMYRHWMSNQ